MAELLTLADIVGVHGIKGWLKVRPYLESPETLTELGEVELIPGPRMREGQGKRVKVDAVRAQGKGVIAHIEGLDDRTEAEALRGYVLRVEADRLPAAGDGEFYWRDLEGLRVWCRDGEKDPVLLGEVNYLLDTGSNDVIVIKACEGSIDDQERLIPWIADDVVERVDLDAGELWVSWYVDV